MHEETNRCALRDLGRGTEEIGEEHEVVVINPYDVTFSVAGDDGVCETFVDGGIL